MSISTLRNFATGEVKVINSKVHTFIATHPFWAVVIASVLGFLAGKAL